MVINPIIFFDNEIKDYIRQVGNTVPFFSKYYMILLYDESSKSDGVREALNIASEMQANSGTNIVLTYMTKLPDCVENDEMIGSDLIKSEFQKYDYNTVYSKMRFIATRFGVLNKMPVLLVASRIEKGCIPINISGNDWTRVNGIIGSISYLLEKNYTKIHNLQELKYYIDKKGINCEYKISEDDAIEVMFGIRNRVKPSEIFEAILKKYKIGKSANCIKTEKEVAEEIGVSQKQFGLWKNDRTTPPFDKLMLFFKVNDISIDDANKLLDSFGYREINRTYAEDNELWNQPINRIID